MEHSVELMIGIVFFILGLSYLFHATDWSVLIDQIQKKGRRASLTIGILIIFWGSFILAFHWSWQGLSMITSIIGLILVIKGSVYLLWPSWLPAKIAIFERYDLKATIRLSGIIVIIMASAVLYGWWQNSYSSRTASRSAPDHQTTEDSKLA